MAALPECLAGRLACRGRREEEEEKIFERRHGIRRNPRDARIIRQLAIAGRGSDQDKSPHKFGIAEDQALGDVAADGEAKHVHGLQAQSADKVRYVIGRRVDRVRGLAARARDPGIVEQDYGTPARKAIGHDRIPMVETGAEMCKKDERGSLFRSEARLYA